MSRLFNTFEFIGEIQLPKSKDKFYDVKTSDRGWEGHRLNFAVKESKTNSVFLEMYGGYSHSKKNTVITFGKGTESVKGAKLEVPWEDRLDQETVDMVADFKKIVIDFTKDQGLKNETNRLRYEIRNIEYKDEPTQEELSKLKQLKQELKEKATDRYEFIHEYDAVKFLSENLENNSKNNKFRVTGSITYQEYKGKYIRKFKPELIEIVSNDEPSKLRATFDIFFTKDSIDEKDFEKEKKIYINGYVMSYDGQHKKDMFFPQQFIINATKVDMNNEIHLKRLEFLENQFKVKGKGVYHLQWHVNIFRGADEVEFSEANLTPKQKEAIEFGYNKLEDFAPKGGMFGETTEENRLIKPILQEINKENDFKDGAKETDLTVEDLVYVPIVKDDNPPFDVGESSKEVPDEKFNVTDFDDLFS